MTQKAVGDPTKLKRMVLDAFPDLMEARGIFSRSDQSRVIGRHDDDTSPSEKARLEHIKKLATMVELSWIGDKSAHSVLVCIESLKNKANLTKLDYDEKCLAVEKKNPGYSYVLETDQAKEIAPDKPVINSLPAGSHADFVVQDDQGGARLHRSQSGFPWLRRKPVQSHHAWIVQETNRHGVLVVDVHVRAAKRDTPRRHAHRRQ
jgi:uncharacterized protein (DUF2141 family)